MATARVLDVSAHRHWLFLLAGLLSCLIFRTPLKALITLAIADERYTHILIIPVVSAGLLYLKRRRFPDPIYRPKIGAPLALLGLGLLLASKLSPGLSAELSIAIAGLVFVWIGLFISFYGVSTFKYATVPWLLLLLMVPVPGIILDKVVAALQVGSAEVSYRMFRLAGVPVFRNGVTMSLPGVDVEVAPQCSGIRSTMALFIAGIVLADISLRSGWGKLFVILCIGPIGVFRNAVRIVTLTLLGLYVNKDFYFGNLHRRGGLAFAVIGFIILIPLIWLIRICEQRVESAHAAKLGFSEPTIAQSGSGIH